MTTGPETAESAGDRGEPRRPKLTITSPRWVLAVLAFAGGAGVVGLVVHGLRASSAPPADVRPDGPATPLSTRPPVYPLRVGPTGRYLVDRKGRPFLVVGDSPQALIARV